MHRFVNCVTVGGAQLLVTYAYHHKYKITSNCEQLLQWSVAFILSRLAMFVLLSPISGECIALLVNSNWVSIEMLICNSINQLFLTESGINLSHFFM